MVGALRVWWVRNAPSKAEYTRVNSVEEAKKVLKDLADKDLKAGDEIFMNAGGLEVYVGTDVDYETNNGWEDYYDEEGRDIDELMEEEND